MISISHQAIDLWIDDRYDKLVLFRKEYGNRIVYFQAKPHGTKIKHRHATNSKTYFDLIRKHKGSVILQ